MKKIIACPLCNLNANKEIIKPKIDVTDPKKLYGAADGIRGSQRIVRCLICNLVFENPRLPEDDILKGYSHSKGDVHDSQHEMRIKSFRFALNRNRRWLPPRGSKVLDVGTAGGAFLDAAKDFGYDAVGLEPSVDLVKRGTARKLNIQHGTIQKNRISNEKFDLICFWDVLEHVSDPREALSYASNLLTEHGQILINFPNIGTLQAKIARKNFWWIISVHLVHFTNATLDKICALEGFIPVRKIRYWQILEFGYLLNLASNLGVPFLFNWHLKLPRIIRKLPLPYYASQTTAIYKKNK